jgi:Domain of unknown function(DUF2779)
MLHLVSKTDYMRWRECQKNAWLAIHKPDFYYSFEPSEFELALRETGEQVESMARGLFPNGVLVGGRDERAWELTQKLINAKTPTIFQPVFAKDGFIAIADILTFNANTDSYTIYETKSSSNEKNEYLVDVAFQALLLRRCRLKVNQAYLVHLNPDYVRHGDLNLHGLFVFHNMTGQIGEVENAIVREMEESKAYLVTESEPAGHCTCIYKGRSNHCTTFSYSNPHVPAYGVHDISRIGNSPKKLKEMVDAGIFELDRIPAHIQLSEAQRNQIDVYTSGEVLINKAAIAAELNGLQFPLHFIDYETHLSAIPLFDGWSPNKQVPFQYSLHVVESPGREVIHNEFLHTVLRDPDVPFAMSLKEHLGPSGSIIVWNKTFECSHVNRPIAMRHPEFSEFFFDFEKRVYDLADIFSKRYYIHRGFLGKTSIKNILPVLVPELSYQELDINEGSVASAAWPRLVSGKLNEAERKKICDDLRKYCGLDSYAMCAIWMKLREIITT